VLGLLLLLVLALDALFEVDAKAWSASRSKWSLFQSNCPLPPLLSSKRDDAVKRCSVGEERRGRECINEYEAAVTGVDLEAGAAEAVAVAAADIEVVRTDFEPCEVDLCTKVLTAVLVATKAQLTLGCTVFMLTDTVCVGCDVWGARGVAETARWANRWAHRMRFIHRSAGVIKTNSTRKVSKSTSYDTLKFPDGSLSELELGPGR